MWDDKIWTYEQAIPNDAPDDYKKYALEHAKEEVGRKLYGILEQTRLPAVVDLIEEIHPHTSKEYQLWSAFDQQHIDYAKERGWDRLRISVRVNPVKYRDVEMVRPSFSASMYLTSPKFFDRLYWLITGKMRNFLNYG